MSKEYIEGLDREAGLLIWTEVSLSIPTTRIIGDSFSFWANFV